MMKKLSAVVSLGIFLAANTMAQTTVPYIFKAGTPANANDVNANFCAVTQEIDSLIEHLQQRYFVTFSYSTNINYSTSFGYLFSESAKATCPSSQFLLSGSVTCSGTGTDFNYVNGGSVNYAKAAGNSFVGSCVADSLHSASKYGPGVNVTIVCGEIVDTTINASSSLRSADDP